jgi:tRNA threonylcarbamoyladenosine biosynthesis protein TsaE
VSALESSSPEETRRLGEALGRAAEAGDAILLSGELGAGKTVFVQGMARGLDFQGPVSSKSFVLLGEYVGRITLFHADLYRLESPAEVEDLALEEISRDGVLVVEWPERGDTVLPGERLTLHFEVSGPETRRITAEATGARAQALAEALGK